MRRFSYNNITRVLFRNAYKDLDGRKENGNARESSSYEFKSGQQDLLYHECLADNSGTFMFSQYSATPWTKRAKLLHKRDEIRVCVWFRESKLGSELSCILWYRVVSADCLTKNRYFCMQHRLRWHIASTQRYSPALNYTCTRDKEHSPNDVGSLQLSPNPLEDYKFSAI